MTHNRKPCVALIMEAEYDALTLEAYWEARVTTERLKNGRYPFSCIFCKEIHKNKNMTSYHRMFNPCKMFKEPAPLKMYPTWEKSTVSLLGLPRSTVGFMSTTLFVSLLRGRRRRLRITFNSPL